MGSVYRRGDSKLWWLAYYDASGKRCLVSSGSADEAAARKTLSALERRVKAERASGLANSGPITVKAYVEKWLAERRNMGVASTDDDEARLKHALPVIGPIVLKDVVARDVRTLICSLTSSGELAPRTIRHVYGVLRVMFSDAVSEGVLVATPCTLKQRRKELPKKRDKDPLWRSKAVFTKTEVVQLISDGRISERRRVLYGILFLSGMRINELSPRKLEDYSPQATPLGCLSVRTSFSRKHKKEKPGTKTDDPREVPVHPALAKLLASWLAHGWAETYGRAPKSSDWLMPRSDGRRLDCVASLVEFHKDLETLGLRRRRQHDARRTFISLTLGDGASKDLLRWVTHGPEGDIVDEYTTPPWPALCEQVSKLRIHLPGGADGIATVVLRRPESPSMTSNMQLHETGLEAVRFESHGFESSLSGSVSSDSRAPSSASTPGDSQHRSERSSGDYERRAIAAGFRVSP